MAASTVTWTSAADFESGTLANLDATSSPGQLLLNKVVSPWVKLSGNPLFRPGSGWDAGRLIASSLLYEGGVYKMWYEGCVANQCHIGYATSADGLSWTRFGANPVLAGNAGGWDQSIGKPFVLHDGTIYRMWYDGVGGGLVRIGYATSPDGVSWTRQGGTPIPLPQQAWDNSDTTTPVVIKVGATLIMYFSGDSSLSQYSIGRATSADGFNWTEDPANPFLVPTVAWEETRVIASDILVGPSGYDLYYTGGPGVPQIGHASSIDGRSWTKDTGNPVLLVGGSASWDSFAVGYARVLTAAGTTRMYYAGESASASWEVGAASYAPGGGAFRYRASGMFSSAVIDSGSSNTTWGSLAWSGTVVGGTEIQVGIRVGNTAVPDASWLLVTTVPQPGPVSLHLGPHRFAQVVASLVTTNEMYTPALDQIELVYSPPPSSTTPAFPFGLGLTFLVLLALLVLGVIAMLVVVVVLSQHGTAPLGTSSQAYNACPVCGMGNPSWNRFCTNCGRPIGGFQR